MHEYAQGALTYVRHYGRPDLFITFTCNPTWEEIKEYLLPGQIASDRPDIIARIFRQKLETMMDFIVKCQVFVKVRCWMYSIGWQRRGLPHYHALIWLLDKITPDQLDEVISAEIPDPEIDQGLFEIVTKFMIHGPCGVFNKKCLCMKDGRCSKRYPESLHRDTITGNDGRQSTQPWYTHRQYPYKRPTSNKYSIISLMESVSYFTRNEIDSIFTCSETILAH